MKKIIMKKHTQVISLLLGSALAFSTSAIANTFEQAYQSLSAEQLHQHVKIVSSNEFAGRLPTTAGEKKTLDYLSKEFMKAGFKARQQWQLFTTGRII